MNIKTLKRLSYVYLILPVILFILGWIKLIFSIPITIALIIAIVILNKQSEEKDNEKIISIKLLSAIFFILLFVCILAGQGGLFYQSDDHNWRNAVFRDLINEDWPVYYEYSDNYLNYYIGHWMVPAGIAKIFLLISETVAWNIGNILLLLWTTLGVNLTFLWIINAIKNRSKKNIFIALIVFLFFSGLDILGTFIGNDIVIEKMHLEWWATEYQFSCITTQLFWVFNQAIPIWLIVMIFLNEKSVKNYFLLIILCLPYSPLPFLGAMLIFACNGFRILYKSIKEKKLKTFFKDVFSMQNCIALICILPIYYFYYSLNQSTMENGLRFLSELSSMSDLMDLLIFWFLEIGIYFVVLCKNYKKSSLFWVSFISLIFIPLFTIGSERDFAMRASIPCLFVSMIFVIDFLLNKSYENNKISKILIVSCLVIGMITPLFEYARAVKEVAENGKIRLVADEIVTFSDKEPERLFKNFMAQNNSDSIFIKYLKK